MQRIVSGVYYPEVGEQSNPITFRKNRQHLNSFPEHIRPNTKENWSPLYCRRMDNTKS